MGKIVIGLSEDDVTATYNVRIGGAEDYREAETVTVGGKVYVLATADEYNAMTENNVHWYGVKFNGSYLYTWDAVPNAGDPVFVAAAGGYAFDVSSIVADSDYMSPDGYIWIAPFVKFEIKSGAAAGSVVDNVIPFTFAGYESKDWGSADLNKAMALPVGATIKLTSDHDNSTLIATTKDNDGDDVETRIATSGCGSAASTTYTITGAATISEKNILDKMDVLILDNNGADTIVGTNTPQDIKRMYRFDTWEEITGTLEVVDERGVTFPGSNTLTIAECNFTVKINFSALSGYVLSDTVSVTGYARGSSQNPVGDKLGTGTIVENSDGSWTLTVAVDGSKVPTP